MKRSVSTSSEKIRTVVDDAVKHASYALLLCDRVGVCRESAAAARGRDALHRHALAFRRDETADA
eukprot:6200881-Pleurochrysis_carterae.AAC.1